MNGLSLFSNVGIAETYLKDCGIEIVVANELIENRAKMYKHLYPECKMICGDIYEKFDEIIMEAKKRNCEFLIATPPCQGMSIAGKRDYSDPRNLLIFKVFEAIDILKPKYVIIENVPQLLKQKFKIDGKYFILEDFLYDKYSSIYNINRDKILNTEDYEIPQSRKRAIILMSTEGIWEFPRRSNRKITVRETIGDFPSLDPIIKEEKYRKYFPNAKEKMIKGKEFHKWHFPKEHSWRHVEIMMHTPTGKSAFGNEKYYPKREDGKRVKGYNTTYKRMEWDKPAPTITMANGSISSQCNVHPGRLQPDGTYSDARVLTVYEIMKLFTLPDDWNIPDWATDSFIRKVIGEGVPPLLIKKIVRNRE